jgi:protein subunit release factor A
MAAVEQEHTVFEQYHNILTSLEELKKMKSETPPKDMETHELLEEEIENSQELLQEAEEKAIELLVPPDKYDDCNLINIEIRPG